MSREKVERNLGELAAMSRQTEDAERKLMARAKELLAHVESAMPGAQASALTGGGDRYQELVAERARLQQVIAAAKKALGQ